MRQPGSSYVSRERIKRHALADPCEECEAPADSLQVSSLGLDTSRGVITAVVTCSVCGHEHIRDILDSKEAAHDH